MTIDRPECSLYTLISNHKSRTMKKAIADICCGHEHFQMIDRQKALVDLEFQPSTKAALAALQAKFPGRIVITSGRRSVADQARVMAHNIVGTGDRKWIQNTYVQSPARKELQDWVDAHPEAKTEAQLGAGLLGIMNGWDEAKCKTISYHITGAAFDLEVVTGTIGEDIKTYIKTLAHLNKFLERESGVAVWHLQFDE